MTERQLPQGIQGEIALLAGSILNSVTIAPFRVDFQFLGSVSRVIIVKKKFGFFVNGTNGQFVADATLHHPTEESTGFVFLQGKRCVEAVINVDELQISFDGAATLRVEFGQGDFEPIEYIGASGANFEKLDFMHVL